MKEIWNHNAKRRFLAERTWREQAITAEVTPLDEGLYVLLAGGDSSHIGAVSMIGPDEDLRTIVSSGHKEAVLTKSWAATLFTQFQCPVTVAAGVHFDDLTRDEIAEVVDLTEELLDEVLDHEI